MPRPRAQRSAGSIALCSMSGEIIIIIFELFLRNGRVVCFLGSFNISDLIGTHTSYYLIQYACFLHTRLIFPSGEGRDEEALARVCASWRKFLALADLLEYSLTDVAEWLPRTLHCCLLFSAYCLSDFSPASRCALLFFWPLWLANYISLYFSLLAHFIITSSSPQARSLLLSRAVR